MDAFIDRYQILSEIGRGGMAVVYRAFDPQSQRQVALKMLPREYLHEPQFRARFQREIEILTKFRHPGIVHIYGYGQFHGQPYLVMQYMPGGSLEDRLKHKGTFSLEETVSLLDHLAPALEAAHQQKIIHRDLKPNNILFDEHKQPYIADFGIARLAEHGGQTKLTGSLLIGTPAYMSPEQAKSGEVDVRSDVYALGVIAYELLTGRLPYDADTPMKLALKHIMDPIPEILSANPSLPHKLKKVMPKVLAKNPSDRYTTPSEFVSALQEIAQQKTTPAHLTPQPGLLKKSIVRPIPLRSWFTPARLAGIGGILIILCLLFVTSRLKFFSLSSPTLVPPSPSTPLLLETPSPPPQLTEVVEKIILEKGQAGVMLNNGQAFIENEELSAKTGPLEVLIYDRENIQPGYLYAAQGSFLRFDTINEKGFQLSITAGSRIFVETGAYPYAKIQPVQIPGLTLQVEGSCMAVDVSEKNVLKISCYEGNCAYEVFGGIQGTITTGTDLWMDMSTLTILENKSISQTEAESYLNLVNRNPASSACVSHYLTNTAPLPTNTPTLPPTPQPGFATWTPTHPPTKTPKPSDTPTLPPGITPSKTPSPTQLSNPTQTSTLTQTPPLQPEATITPSKTPSPSTMPTTISVSPTNTSQPSTPTRTSTLTPTYPFPTTQSPTNTPEIPTVTPKPTDTPNSP